MKDGPWVGTRLKKSNRTVYKKASRDLKCDEYNKGRVCIAKHCISCIGLALCLVYNVWLYSVTQG